MLESPCAAIVRQHVVSPKNIDDQKKETDQLNKRTTIEITSTQVEENVKQGATDQQVNNNINPKEEPKVVENDESTKRTVLNITIRQKQTTANMTKTDMNEVPENVEKSK